MALESYFDVLECKSHRSSPKFRALGNPPPPPLPASLFLIYLCSGYCSCKTDQDMGWNSKINPLINPYNSRGTCSDKNYYYYVWYSVQTTYIPNLYVLTWKLTDLSNFLPVVSGLKWPDSLWTLSKSWSVTISLLGPEETGLSQLWWEPCPPPWHTRH